MIRASVLPIRSCYALACRQSNAFVRFPLPAILRRPKLPDRACLGQQAAGRERPVAADQSFPVVGVGASAGGVEALEGFFRPMPADTGMAFVVVTHMPSGHTTTLPEILARYTDMAVSNIAHGE